MKIGHNIIEAREAQKLTQVFMAKELGISVDEYVAIENDNAEITLTLLESIANTLSYSPADLLSPNQQKGVIKNIFVNQSGNQGININIQGIDQEQIRKAYKELYTKEIERIPKFEKLLKNHNILFDF